ncbi:DUF429 domain-containing protein [Proteiniclasticum sp. QWL-01]|uniref:DUF429 domain-containing protein n=1 Tax=Proteiniclasticum sp. QWL-01 TaxID=3036945 RepID=UPI0024104356|nr:DUF429 domain-containing protein [Proteiniclasticum sp. QWL-01]WFF72994.1 DUF429 domain-containing protein [Proteiniclasticum sp. QWL-01]
MINTIYGDPNQGTPETGVPCSSNPHEPVKQRSPKKSTQLQFSARNESGPGSQSGTPGSQVQQFLAAGIDGCKGKWLGIELSEQTYHIHLFDHISEICAFFRETDRILLDMPIGLAESPADRRPEPELRRYLKGKASSVFNAPCRQALNESDHSTASAVNRKYLGKGLSRQTFNIMPKIQEVDRFLEMNPEWKDRLWESHPEYCFSLLNKGMPIAENKQTSAGALVRLELLTVVEPRSPRILTTFQELYLKLARKTDDLLDALVLAVIGRIGLEGQTTSLPEPAPRDPQGIPMRIMGATVSLIK